jgi:uncharacterized membrane protein YhiD involved in acid resistance
MNKIQTFQEFLTTQSVQIPIAVFIVNLLLAAILASILGKIYVRYGDSLSNRKQFSKNFILMTMITMLIISIVKSSLALSLGLVGALSIVRFRAAIKEPEELMYLFFSIAVGLGLGADQTTVTVTAFIIICLIIIAKRKFWQKDDENENLILTITGKSNKIKLEDIVGLLKEYCTGLNVKRFDENDELIESAFQVEFSDFEKLSEMKNRLKTLDNSVMISFVDQKGIY